MNPSPFFNDLFDRLPEESSPDLESDEPSISINSLTHSAGTFYEKIRYLVDYQEEHVIRRSAIERILRRKFILENAPKTGRELIEELIAGSYLPNNKISEHVARELEHILDRYRGYLSMESPALKVKKGRSKRRGNLFNIASTDIELFLFPQPLDEAIADAMYLTVRESVQFDGTDPEKLDMQVYIGCRRSLLKEDNARLRYALWLRYVPLWHSLDHADQEHFHAEEILKEIDRDLNDPLSWQIVPKLRNETIYFLVIREIMAKYGPYAKHIFTDDATPDVDAFIRSFLDEQYEKITTRARSSGLRAAIYIVCTKVVLALLIELPYEIHFLSAINYVALESNIIFHPLLLLSMTRTIQKPDKKNTETIVNGVHDMVLGKKVPIKKIRSARPYSGFTFVLSLLYLLLFITTFGVIIRTLQYLRFNSVSILLFLLFLTLVSYFGIRIRYNAKSWKVTTDESTIGFLWAIFTLPIMRVGRWLSVKFTTINVFVFVLDFIIETPFKMVLRVFDAFITFLKEIREQTY